MVVLITLFQYVPEMDEHTPVHVLPAAWASKTISLSLGPAEALSHAHQTPARGARGKSKTFLYSSSIK